MPLRTCRLLSFSVVPLLCLAVAADPPGFWERITPQIQ
jgi:hypothetical protein